LFRLIIAKAILAAAAVRSFNIRFDGPVAMQYADDVARMFIGTARAEFTGAAACNLRNDMIEVADFVKMIQEAVPNAHITYTHDSALPFPADLDDSGLRQILGDIPHTRLRVAIQQTLGQFQTLLAEGRVDLSQLDK